MSFTFYLMIFLGTAIFLITTKLMIDFVNSNYVYRRKRFAVVVEPKKTVRSSSFHKTLREIEFYLKNSTGQIYIENFNKPPGLEKEILR